MPGLILLVFYLNGSGLALALHQLYAIGRYLHALALMRIAAAFRRLELFSCLPANPVVVDHAPEQLVAYALEGDPKKPVSFLVHQSMPERILYKRLQQHGWNEDL
jgi:hypothetical protein